MLKNNNNNFYLQTYVKLFRKKENIQIFKICQVKMKNNSTSNNFFFRIKSTLIKQN